MRPRPDRPDDQPAIRALLEDCFPAGGEAGLVAALRAGGHVALSLVAEADGDLAGHVLLSRMAAPEGALGLGPVATTPQARGRGVASALIREALAQAAREGWRAVFVLGEPGFYGRFGFSTEAARGWSSPYAGPYFQALALVPGALSGGGKAGYAPPFAAL